MNTTSNPFMCGTHPAPPSHKQDTSFTGGFGKCYSFAPPSVNSQQKTSTKQMQQQDNSVSSCSGSSFSNLQGASFRSSQASATTKQHSLNFDSASNNDKNNNKKADTQWDDNRPEDPMDICYYFSAFCEKDTKRYQVPRH